MKVVKRVTNTRAEVDAIQGPDWAVCLRCGTRWPKEELKHNKPMELGGVNQFDIRECPKCKGNMDWHPIVHSSIIIPPDKAEEGLELVLSEMLPPPEDGGYLADAANEFVKAVFEEVLPLGRELKLKINDYGMKPDHGIRSWHCDITATVRYADNWSVQINLSANHKNRRVDLRTRRDKRWVVVQTEYGYDPTDLAYTARDRIKKGFELNEFIDPVIENRLIRTSGLSHLRMTGLYGLIDGIWLVEPDRGQPVVPVLSATWSGGRYYWIAIVGNKWCEVRGGKYLHLCNTGTHTLTKFDKYYIDALLKHYLEQTRKQLR